MNKSLEKITKVSLYSLSLIPLLKENFNSLCIIIFTLLVIFYLLKNKIKPKFGKEFLFSTLLFWMFFLYQLFTPEIDFKAILKHLPFLIIPFIFINKPIFIGLKEKRIAITTFQISVLFQCLFYVITFFIENGVNNFFYVSNENIPFFREYVLNNYLFKIHPTYFSAYLLLSFTFSLFKILNVRYLNLFNLIVTTFFIFIFSSRIVIVAYFLTVICFMFLRIRELKLKQRIIFSGLVIIFFILIIAPNRNIFFKRFNEIKTEINKPVEGNYYNSTNTRVAIIKCSINLFKELPVFGYGDSLQKELNNCYEASYNSNFYKISGEFNTHNYYVHNLLFGGVFYFLLFLLFLTWIFKRVRKSPIGIFILIQFLIINLTENYLIRHYGIVTFMYFTALIIFIKSDQDQKTKNTTAKPI